MSAWVNHIKELAKTSGKSYSACLKDPESKKSYTPVEKKPASAKPRVKKELAEGEVAKEKKPRAPRKKKDEATLEIIYDKTEIGNTIGRLASEDLFMKKSKRELSLLIQSAEERYLNLFTEQPELLQFIPLKYIASYIGVTPQALSRIRKRIS